MNTFEDDIKTLRSLLAWHENVCGVHQGDGCKTHHEYSAALNRIEEAFDHFRKRLISKESRA